MNPDDFEKSIKLAEKAGYKKMKHKSAHFGIVCKNNKGKIWIHEIKWLRDRFRKKDNFIQDLNKIGLELTEIREILSKKKEIPDKLLEINNYDVDNWKARQIEIEKEKEQIRQWLYKIGGEDE